MTTLGHGQEFGGNLEETAAPQPVADKFSPELIKLSLSQGNAVDLSELTRAERLSVINTFLISEGLKPLDGILDASKKEIEITGINGLTRDPYKPEMFVVRVDFAATLGGGSKFNHLCYINANTANKSSALFVPVIRVEGADSPSHIVLVEQGRLVVGGTTKELPRGFVPPAGESVYSGSLKGLMETLSAETGLSAEQLVGAGEVENIGSVFENTGTHIVKNDVLVVPFVMSESEVRELEQRSSTDPVGAKIRVRVLPIDQAPTVLSDNHSWAAFGKYLATQRD